MCALLSCRPNRLCSARLGIHRRFSSMPRYYTKLFCRLRSRVLASSSDATSSPPRSATGCLGCSVCSARAVAAHFSIALTEQRHRQSSAVRPSSDRRGRRQDNVRSVVVGLHRSSSAGADSYVSDGASQRAAAMRFKFRRAAHRCAPSRRRSLVWVRCAVSVSVAVTSPT